MSAQPVCPNCGRAVEPIHFYRSGTTRCQNRLRWTRARLWKLAELIERGTSDEEIGRRLGVTVNAVRLARKHHGLKPRTKAILCCRAVARRMGLSCSKRVAWWIKQGWLKGRLGQPRGKYRQWYVEERDFFAFLEDEERWPLWDPAAITIPSLREWALQLRSGVRFLTQAEVATRYFVERATVQQWIDKGYLPSVSGGSHRMVRESDIEGFAPPELGLPRAKFERLRAAGRVTRPICQAQTEHGHQECMLTARFEVQGVRLCRKHHAVLQRRGAVPIYRERGGPVEHLVLEEPEGLAA